MGGRDVPLTEERKRARAADALANTVATLIDTLADCEAVTEEIGDYDNTDEFRVALLEAFGIAKPAFAGFKTGSGTARNHRRTTKMLVALLKDDLACTGAVNIGPAVQSWLRTERPKLLDEVLRDLNRHQIKLAAEDKAHQKLTRERRAAVAQKQFGGVPGPEEACDNPEPVQSNLRSFSGTTAVQVENPLPSKPSIVVLPFSNLSHDPEQQYFAEGMVVEITNALSCFKSLFVIASSSALTLTDMPLDVRRVAEKLGVRYVLEGSVQKSGSKVRITVRLIDASDGMQIWNDRFQGELDDVFALQDDITMRVAGWIEPKVQAAELRRGSKGQTTNLGSYDLYLRALPLVRTFGRDSVRKALDLLKRAVDLDPDFGLALSLAAICHRNIYTNGWAEDLDSHKRQALVLARKAQMASADDAHVLARVASLQAMLGEDQTTTIRLIDRAIELNPGSALVWQSSGNVRLCMGELLVGIEHIKAAMRLDPMGPTHSSHCFHLGRARFQQGRFAESVSLLNESIQSSGSPFPFALAAASLAYLGRIDDAKAAIVNYRTLTSEPIVKMARTFMREPLHVEMLLGGIALAEVNSERPSEPSR